MGGDPATTTTTTPVEPGYTTTEFWATEVASGITLAGAIGIDFGLFHLTTTQQTDITMAAVFVIGLMQGLYAIARGFRKAGQ
jgi:hypothetical protein